MATMPRPVAVEALSSRSLVLDPGLIAAGLTAAGGVAGLGFANGGYFPVSWGWGALAFFIVAAVALVVSKPRVPTGLGLTAFGLLAALAAWTLGSTAWSLDVTETVEEAERTLVYVAAAAAMLLLVTASRAFGVLVGVWAATTALAVAGLAIWLFPQEMGFTDPTWRYRLSAPVGYWNAFGVLCAVGVVLAFGLAAHRRGALRVAAGSSTVILLTTLYFTFSRGALGALALGLVVAVAADRHRLRLVGTACILAPAALVCVFAASRSSALTTGQASLQAVERDGHGMAVIALCLTAAAAFAMLVWDAFATRLRVPRTATVALAGVLAAAVVAAGAGATVRYGSPVTITGKAYHAFVDSPSPTQNDLQSRMLSVSGNGRAEEWHTAVSAAAGHPWLGTGAGTFDVYWFQHRRVPVSVHDAHNLYLETLAELGPVGLALLIGFLAVPVVAFARARRHPLAAVALGAYVVFLAHAAVDWDWEMPAVTLAGLFVGFALVGAARKAELPPLRLPGRLLGTTAVAACGGVVVWTLLGNIALSSSAAAAESGKYAQAARDARRADTFLPWSSQPLRRLGEAQAGAGQTVAARHSFVGAAAREPRDWTLWFDLAQVSRGAARKAALAEALTLDPLSPEIANWHP
jgi:hypothetical protein